MEPNTIHCPKCQSTQLHFAKKGFSGKKAVVGGILTGGLGLFAGTIGSNKILANCMSCGNKFSPVKPKPTPIPFAKTITPKPIIAPTAASELLLKNKYKASKQNCFVITILLFTWFGYLVINKGFSFSVFCLMLVTGAFASITNDFWKLSKKPLTDFSESKI